MRIKSIAATSVWSGGKMLLLLATERSSCVKHGFASKNIREKKCWVLINLEYHYKVGLVPIHLQKKVSRKTVPQLH